MKNFEIAGYTILPLQLPEVPGFDQPATHFLYLRPHEPRIPDPDSPRSLFLVNIPVDTTETHLRHLFSTQLSAGRVERVQFESVPIKKAALVTPQGSDPKSKKRKRATADEIQSRLDEISLPSTWDRGLQHSGAHAIVVFVDKPSMEASLKAARKVGRNSHKKDAQKVTWGEGIEDRLPPLGLQRYLDHERKVYPARAELLRAVNDYMSVFEEVADARKKEDARRVQEPDEDGFITVTSGPRLTSAAHEEEAKRLIEKQKKQTQGFDDFYRFQSRERRKEKQNELLKKFDQDKKKLEEMKMRKGKIRPE